MKKRIAGSSSNITVTLTQEASPRVFISLTCPMHLVRLTVAALCAVVLICPSGASDAPRTPAASQKFARFVGGNGSAVYGIVDGENLREITAAPWTDWK